MRIKLLIAFGLLSFTLTKAELHPLYSSADRHFKAQEYDSALVLFNQMIQQFPDRKEGYFNRGLCLYKTEKYSEALLDFNDCLLLDSTLSVALFLTGRCRQQTGDWELALQSFGKISEPDATIFNTRQRIKNYHLSVYIATRWYYMIAMALLFILLIATVVSLFSGVKNR